MEIHSIEQPIKPGNLDQMEMLCKTTPTPIALDEELIGILDFNDKKELLLQKRSVTKKSHPNCWDISGAGHIRAGESVIDGAIRELKEELGVEVEEKDLQYIATIKVLVINLFTVLYFLNWVLNRSIRCTFP